MTIRLKYPNNIESKMHLLLRAYDYKLPDTGQRAATATSTNQEKVETPVTIHRGAHQFSVRTYIPGGFGDQSSSEWSMKPVALTGSFQNFADLQSNFGNIAGGIGAAFATDLAEKLLGALPEQIRNTAEAGVGTRLAPNETKIFQGSKPRSIELAFDMWPNDQKEADQVSEIVDAFRFASVPSLGDTLSIGGQQIFQRYNYPLIFDINVVNPGKGSAKTGTFVSYPMMALDNFSVKYNGGSNVYEHFEDGGPINTQITLSFSALFPSFNKSGTWNGRKGRFGGGVSRSQTPNSNTPTTSSNTSPAGGQV